MQPSPSPARANFTLMIDCTPESSGCYSVYSVGEHQAVLGCLAKWPHSFLGCAEQKQSEKLRLFLLPIAAKNYKWKEAKNIIWNFFCFRKRNASKTYLVSLHYTSKQNNFWSKTCASVGFLDNDDDHDRWWKIMMLLCPWALIHKSECQSKYRQNWPLNWSAEQLLKS